MNKILDHALNNYEKEKKMFLDRIIFSFIWILILFSILIVNLFFLQVIHFKNYYIRSDQNRIKLIPIFPKRGIIYDRNKIPLATNRTIYQLELISEKAKDVDRTISDLQSIVGLTKEDIFEFKNKSRYFRHLRFLPIKKGLNDVQKARFFVNQYRFPEVQIKEYQYRYYPYGSAFTHVIGYVSKISDKEIAQTNKHSKNYNNFINTGKLGIERYYENCLQGKIGYEIVEVNNFGRIIRKLYSIPPKNGSNIILTLDSNLQRYIKKLLNGSRAAVIVVDPRDGEIIAMVSNPSYDPNLFVNGISNQDYHRLLRDKDKPLINRATQGIYPPASTVKPYISVSALSLGIIDENFSLFDPGWWKLPGSEKRYRDWKRLGHGKTNVVKAIEESADTFFYRVAYDMGIDRLSEWMKRFGYGQRTGIDLLEESTGIMPSRDWKKKKIHKPWYQGDTISVGIGQGYWTATPLQMLHALMILINNGSVLTPHILLSREEGEKQILYRQNHVIQVGDPKSNFWEIVKDGMYGVANRINGTASKTFVNSDYKIAAKSGTAQLFSLKLDETYNVENINERLRDHKLMVAFAPFKKPRVATVVILENGGMGLEVGCIARKILDFLILKEKILDKIENISFH